MISLAGRDIAPLVARQAAMLDALWPLLRPGGRLLYATCSLLPAENAEQVSRMVTGSSTSAGSGSGCSSG